MSTCQDFEFFEAGPEWQEKILKLWRQVFVSWSDETAEIIADRLNSGFLTGTVRLAAVRNRRTGELIAAVRLEDAMFAGNSGEDRKGIHVGEVAVLPAYQGCGAGTFLMKNAMALIKEVPRDGSFAFLVFCIAFGVILSISRMARKRIQEEEEAAIPIYASGDDDIQVSMDILEQIDNDL